ncbi:DsbA family protein [Streptomyces sp. NPDC048172]|uniref:DsbA family protein n=1 Tax=Streptomyces sp. NPDC048172 TaxID=3365505 RepID=UPI00370F88AA
MIPAHTTGQGGTTVVYGESAGPVLHVYADPRCPYCKRMENGLGETLRHLADEGTFRLHYHFATFLDEALGGKGSHQALNALGAAANTGQAEFLGYLRALYANQPHEEHDGFAEPRTLLGLANDVEGLRSPEFENAVLEYAFESWVEDVSQAFEDSGVEGTPTVLFGERPVAVLDRTGHAVTPEMFIAQLQEG